MSRGRTVFKALAAICAALLLGAAIAMAAFSYMLNEIMSDIASLFSSPSAQEALEDGAWSQPFREIDFAAGPVDLVVETGAGRFLLRDQDQLKRVAMKGFPDFSGSETGRLALSILFLSPPTSGIDETGLTFLRDGRTLAKAECWTSVCGADPTLAAYLDELTARALPLVSHSEFFTDHDEYLAMRQKVLDLPDRFGPLSPETAEEFDPLPQRIYLTFPVIYADGLTEEQARAHAESLVEAIRARFAAQQQEFRLISAPKIAMEREQLYLQDCGTGQPIVIDGKLAPVPPGYGFASISLGIASSRGFAEQLPTTDDWPFLPRGPADDAALTQAIRQDLVAQGLPDDAARCVSVQNSLSGDTLRIMHDMFAGYHLGWTTIGAKATD